MSLNDHWVAMSETQPWKFFALQRLNFQSLKLNFQFLEGNFKMSEPCELLLAKLSRSRKIPNSTASTVSQLSSDFATYIVRVKKSQNILYAAERIYR